MSQVERRRQLQFAFTLHEREVFTLHERKVERKGQLRFALTLHNGEIEICCAPTGLRGSTKRESVALKLPTRVSCTQTARDWAIGITKAKVEP